MLDADWDTIEYDDQDIDPKRCRALFCAVIQEQFRLAVRPKAVDRQFEIDQARFWFGSRDFFFTCDLAGVDGGYVLMGVRNRLQQPGVA